MCDLLHKIWRDVISLWGDAQTAHKSESSHECEMKTCARRIRILRFSVCVFFFVVFYSFCFFNFFNCFLAENSHDRRDASHRRKRKLKQAISSGICISNVIRIIWLVRPPPLHFYNTFAHCSSFAKAIQRCNSFAAAAASPIEFVRLSHINQRHIIYMPQFAIGFCSHITRIFFPFDGQRRAVVLVTVSVTECGSAE